MGSPLAPVLAELYMRQWEEKYLPTIPGIKDSHIQWSTDIETDGLRLIGKLIFHMAWYHGSPLNHVNIRSPGLDHWYNELLLIAARVLTSNMNWFLSWIWPKWCRI
ncbi:hypothetical protein ACOME3_002729 [Neoechinorhynchus agilis]